MKNDEESFADKKAGEEEILDFEFDDLSKDDGDMESEVDEEEIIELVDVVERGEEPAPPVSETAEIERLLDEEGSLDALDLEIASEEGLEKETGVQDQADSQLLEPVEEDFDLIESEETRAIPEQEITANLEEETQDLELDLDSALETIEPLEEEVSSEEWAAPETPEGEGEGEAGLEKLAPIDEEETPPAEDETGLEELTPMVEEEEASLEQEDEELEELTPMVEEEVSLEEEAAESTIKLPAEDLSAIPEPVEDQVIMVASDLEPALESVTRISQERMEEIIAQAVKEAVQDSIQAVVERAAKEAMTDVAERLITEAIQALKDSIAAESE